MVWAWALPSKAPERLATAVAAMARWRNFMVCLLVRVGCDGNGESKRGGGSVRERPDAQLLLGDAPHLGQAMRLDDQEPDDQRAEDHDLGVR